MKTFLQLFFLIALIFLAADIATHIPGESPRPITIAELGDIEFPTPATVGEEISAPQPSPPPLPTPPPPRPTPLPASPPPPSQSPAPSPLDLLPAAPIIPLAILSDQDFYARFSGAIVQIFCTSSEKFFSASGVIVNERGLILTNAHVANIVKSVGEANCQARHGNPADPFAKVELVFIADTTLKIPETTVPQRDVAFLRLRDATASFTAAEVTTSVVDVGTTILTLGYPSEFLAGLAASNFSNLVFSALRVENFADVDGDLDTAEGYVFHGGLVLQQGSSGTALFTRSGNVIGIIFATTKGATTADRDGVAFMTPYLDRVLQDETGEGLSEFIASH